MKRFLACLALLSAPALAAVTGTVINRSTGQPQPGLTVVLNKLDQNGPEPIGDAKTDAQGNFTINQVTGPMPHLLRTDVEGVSYFRMLPPGAPTTGVTLDIYSASKEPGGAKVSKHMLLFEPAGGRMTVNESFIVTNDGKTAWSDPKGGTVHFYLPKDAGGKADVKSTAPGGMSVDTSIVKTGKPDEYGIDFAIKPGETRIDVTYSVPYTAGAPYTGRIPSQDENTYLIAPNGIAMKGGNLSDLGTEPRTQAHIFGLAGTTYNVELTGEEIAAPAPDAADQQQDSSGPQIEVIPPKIFAKAPLILGLALGILALGFVLLYRAPAQPRPAKETNERGRR